MAASLPELTMSGWLRFDAIRRALTTAAPRTVLEFGAGQGALAVWLAARFGYIGVEPDDASRAVAQTRLAKAGSGRVMESADCVDDAAFDLVCAFEVLEHIEDDHAAIESWRTHLCSRGYLLLSVPAHSTRYGLSDEYVGHFRRYDRRDLVLTLEKVGFETVSWETYGAGLGQMIELVRNRVLSHRSATINLVTGNRDSRTAASGRLFQPRSEWRAVANYVAAAPSRAFQVPFRFTDVGIGYVLLARLSS
jgi:cyclopropane fatty-acyl-phospholipid synthase-like methyltransferase